MDSIVRASSCQIKAADSVNLTIFQLNSELPAMYLSRVTRFASKSQHNFPKRPAISITAPIGQELKQLAFSVFQSAISLMKETPVFKFGVVNLLAARAFLAENSDRCRHHTGGNPPPIFWDAAVDTGPTRQRTNIFQAGQQNVVSMIACVIWGSGHAGDAVDNSAYASLLSANVKRR
jgi:hypothetical protein